MGVPLFLETPIWSPDRDLPRTLEVSMCLNQKFWRVDWFSLRRTKKTRTDPSILRGGSPLVFYGPPVVRGVRCGLRADPQSHSNFCSLRPRDSLMCFKIQTIRCWSNLKFIVRPKTRPVYLPQKVAFRKGNPQKFQENPGWWNTIIWPDNQVHWLFSAALPWKGVCVFFGAECLARCFHLMVAWWLMLMVDCSLTRSPKSRSRWCFQGLCTMSESILDDNSSRFGCFPIHESEQQAWILLR